MDQDKLASRLVNLRESSGLSQSEVARRIGIDNSSLSRIESGSRKVSAEELGKFSTLYSVTTDYLLGINHTPKWATQKDVVDLQQMLDDPNYMDQGFAFGGGSLTDSEKEKMRLAITQVFWDRIHDKKIAKKQGDSNAEETN